MKDYRAVDYCFYDRDQLLVIFNEINYFLFSIGTIRYPDGKLLLKYRRSFWGNRIKILFDDLANQIVLKKEKRQLNLFVANGNEKQKISIISPFKIIGNFEGTIFVNNELFGSIVSNYKNRKWVYSFLFEEEDPLLIHYCFVLFSVKYYYYLDEVP